MTSNDVEHDVVIMCMLCCLVASMLSATFAYIIARAQASRPAPVSDPEESISDQIEPQRSAVSEIRFRTNASFF